MEADAVSSRPESPKKKVKSNPAADSEAQPSDYSESSCSSKSNDRPDYNSVAMNGLAPTRKLRHSSAPDSSSERTSRKLPENASTLIQEEEVSSSENSVSQSQKKRSDASASGNADSITNEAEDLTVCDSASSGSTDRL